MYSITRNMPRLGIRNHRPIAKEGVAENLRWLDGSGKDFPPELRPVHQKGADARGMFDLVTLKSWHPLSSEPTTPASEKPMIVVAAVEGAPVKQGAARLVQGVDEPVVNAVEEDVAVQNNPGLDDLLVEARSADENLQLSYARMSRVMNEVGTILQDTQAARSSSADFGTDRTLLETGLSELYALVLGEESSYVRGVFSALDRIVEILRQWNGREETRNLYLARSSSERDWELICHLVFDPTTHDLQACVDSETDYSWYRGRRH